MTYICYRGIEVSARLQYFLLGFEVIVLVVFSIFALVRVYTGNAAERLADPSLSWFWPGGLDFSNVIAPAILIAIFIYWGWDTAVACNEESDDPGTHAGQGRGDLDVPAAGHLRHRDRRRGRLRRRRQRRHRAWAIRTTPPTCSPRSGRPCSATASSATSACCCCRPSILTSASASTQTTILPTARTTLSMGVYKALPESFAKIHRKYLTPTMSTIVMGVVSIFFYVLFTLISSNLLLALIGSVGLMIAFYYGLTGFACVWYYRKTFTAVGARHRDARRGAAARRHHADGGLRLRPDPVRQGRTASSTTTATTSRSSASAPWPSSASARWCSA